MSMTLWIHTLEERTLSNESDDHSLMYRYSEELDRLCLELGVAPLSSFFDSTDLTYNMDEDDYEADDLEALDTLLDGKDDDAAPLALDPETGWAYGIDDMQWFDAARGLETVSALHARLGETSLDEIDEDETQALIDELADCMEVIEDTLSRGGRFHLAIIM